MEAAQVEIDKTPWDEEKVELHIENVKTYSDNPTSFITELRVLSGPQKGALKSNLWFKRKRDGGARKDTTNLFGVFGLTVEDEAYKLKGKSFATTPWYPSGQKYPVFTKIEAITVEDPW